jgi:hypothetical protein
MLFLAHTCLLLEIKQQTFQKLATDTVRKGEKMLKSCKCILEECGIQAFFLI